MCNNTYEHILCVTSGNVAGKSPTAEDFADIAELADEGDAPKSSREIVSQGVSMETTEDYYQKGMAFAQAQTSGSGLTAVSMDTDDYDEESEEVNTNQSLPSNTNKEGFPDQPDSGYGSVPLSDPGFSLDPSFQTPPPDHTLQSTSPRVDTPTSSVEPDEEGKQETGKIESAIPYLIPKDMTLEQLHAKVL